MPTNETKTRKAYIVSKKRAKEESIIVASICVAVAGATLLGFSINSWKNGGEKIHSALITMIPGAALVVLSLLSCIYSICEYSRNPNKEKLPIQADEVDVSGDKENISTDHMSKEEPSGKDPKDAQKSSHDKDERLPKDDGTTSGLEESEVSCSIGNTSTCYVDNSANNCAI